MGDGQHQVWRRGAGVFLALLLFCEAAEGGGGAVPTPAAATLPLAGALSPERWQQLEKSVDRALAWLAAQQGADGSFPTAAAAQPAVTSLCVLAFLSRGHQPGLGPYGGRLDRAIDFVISCQRPDGLFTYLPPEAMHQDGGASHTAVYNHAIAGVMLGEVFGHVNGERMKQVKQAIEQALQFTRELQTRSKTFATDRGGWRYLRLRYDHSAYDSDLSITAWQLMFLRSARNAEFNVPQSYVNDGLDFVKRCWSPNRGIFYYALSGNGGGVAGGRGMVGAGILSLCLAGQHEAPMVLAAGDWLLAHPFRQFGQPLGENDKFFYSAYYCSQAAAQLGGRYWQGIYPALSGVLLGAQLPDGSWPVDRSESDVQFLGKDYSTAMAVLSLTPPYQLLPIYQR
ncbi:MAG: prenyltransferase/squalene oxidase repeat-containing protein [Verrucomicrobiota bacterium]|jgi:hypothetical protein